MGPAVAFVKASAALVAVEEPEQGVGVALCFEAGAGALDEGEAEAVLPMVGMDVEGGELAVLGEAGIAGGHGGGEALDDAVYEGDEGVGFGGVCGGEVVAGGAVFRTEAVEIGGGHESAIGCLPGFYVDAGYGVGVGWLGGAQEHGSV